MSDASTIGATMGRVLTIAAVAAALLLALPAVAGAQEYPPPPRITVENPNVTVIIEGDDWEPGTKVTIVRRVGETQSVSAQSTDVEVLGTATVRPDGTFEFAASDLEAGDEVAVRGAADGGERVDSYAVADDSAEVVASQMPATGLAVWQALALGGGLILAGGVFTVAARRKRSTVRAD